MRKKDLVYLENKKRLRFLRSKLKEDVEKRSALLDRLVGEKTEVINYNGRK